MWVCVCRWLCVSRPLPSRHSDPPAAHASLNPLQHPHNNQQQTPTVKKKAENALEAEKARVAHYLNPAETEEKLLKVVMEELLERQEMTLLER